MKNIANFLFEAGMLKRTPRTGFQFLGSGAESVAEHIFRTSLIGYTLAQLDEEADAGRVVLLCLFHDIPEARTGDLNYVNKKYVKVDERKAVEDLARTLPFGDDYRSLHEEFAAKLTREACLAHDADQLEMILALKEDPLQIRSRSCIKNIQIGDGPQVGKIVNPMMSRAVKS